MFFLDQTFEELEYDVTTTVAEAAENVAHIIKLQNHSTFTLYESRRVCAAPVPATPQCCVFQGWEVPKEGGNPAPGQDSHIGDCSCGERISEDQPNHSAAAHPAPLLVRWGTAEWDAAELWLSDWCRAARLQVWPCSRSDKDQDACGMSVADMAQLPGQQKGPPVRALLQARNN